MSATTVPVDDVDAGVRERESLDFSRITCIALLCFGAVLRVREYVANRSLWLDEVQVALNVIHRSYLDLLKPLAGGQGAPAGWLWLEHAGVTQFGSHEWVLRAVPLLFALGSLPLFYVFVWRWLSGVPAVLAFAMFAVSPELIRYAVEVKPYGSDVFFVLLVVVLTTHLYDQRTRRRLIAWAAGCTVALWFSFAAIIAVTGSIAVLCALERRARRKLRPVVAASCVVGAALAVEYLVNLRRAGDNRILRVYWTKQGAFAPEHFGLRDTTDWLVRSGLHFASNPLDLRTSRTGILLVLLGCACFVARRGWVALFVFSPVLVAIGAALVRQYPLRERLALYLAPLLFVGLAALAESRGPIVRSPTALLGAAAVIIVALPMTTGIEVLWKPIDVIDSRGPYAFVARHWQAGDVVVVESTAGPTYNYYARRYDIPRSFGFRFDRYETCAPREALAQLRTAARFWVVRTHRAGNELRDQNDVDLAYFGSVATRGDTFVGSGQSLAVVFSRGAPSAVPPPSGCVTLHTAPSLAER